MSLFNIKDKRYIVTGATSGIGAEVCRMIDELGGVVHATGRDSAKWALLSQQLQSKQHTFNPMDLNDQVALKQFCDDAGNMDGLVHCAGVASISPIAFLKRSDMEDVWRVNYEAYVLMVKFLHSRRAIRKGGSIVAVSSIAGLFGMKGNGAYAATKSALLGVSRVMAVELAPHRIRVNCIAPGMVRTPMIDQSATILSHEALEKDETKYPLGYGMPCQVAAPIVFLLSDASSWITGQVLIADGGRTATI